jgi:hypothetical protein
MERRKKDGKRWPETLEADSRPRDQFSPCRVARGGSNVDCFPEVEMAIFS